MLSSFLPYTVCTPFGKLRSSYTSRGLFILNAIHLVIHTLLLNGTMPSIVQALLSLRLPCLLLSSRRIPELQIPILHTILQRHSSFHTPLPVKYWTTYFHHLTCILHTILYQNAPKSTQI